MKDAPRFNDYRRMFDALGNRIEAVTFPQANSVVYFHTVWRETGWPARGYELQDNNSYSGPSRTAGLWGIQPYPGAPEDDRTWFTLTIKIKGRRVTMFVNDRLIIDYAQKENPPRPQGLEQRLIASGTFALLGHEPGSDVHYRSIKVRPLPAGSRP